jgi:hypothetical protein
LKKIWTYLVIFSLEKLISAQEDMKIKKNTFTTLILELFCQSIANCRKLKIKKSTSPTEDLPQLYLTIDMSTLA